MKKYNIIVVMLILYATIAIGTFFDDQHYTDLFTENYTYALEFEEVYWNDSTANSSFPASNAVDGDYDTYMISVPGNTVNIRMNYTIPSNVETANITCKHGFSSSSTWEAYISCYNYTIGHDNVGLKSGILGDNENITTTVEVPQECLTGNNLQIRTQSIANPSYTDFNTVYECRVTWINSQSSNLVEFTTNENKTVNITINKYTNVTNAVMNVTAKNNLSQNTTNPYIEIGTLDDKYEWNHSGVFSGGTNKTNSFHTQINAYLKTCTADSNNECQVPILAHSDTAGIILLDTLQINVTNYTANWTFNSTYDGTLIYPTCTRNQLFAFNYTTWDTVETHLSNNYSCSLSGYKTTTSSFYPINVSELFTMVPYSSYLYFNDNVEGIIYPLNGAVKNFTGNLTIDKTEYNDEEQINVEIWKVGSQPNTTKQFFEFVNSQSSDINSTISMSNSASTYIYFRVLDKSNNPIENALVTIYSGYANSSGYTYSITNQRLTDASGYTFINTDPTEKIRLTVLKSGYDLYERIFDADDESPRALANAMSLILDSNSTYESDTVILFVDDRYYSSYSTMVAYVYAPQKSEITYNTNKGTTDGLNYADATDIGNDVWKIELSNNYIDFTQTTETIYIKSGEESLTNRTMVNGNEDNQTTYMLPEEQYNNTYTGVLGSTGTIDENIYLPLLWIGLIIIGSLAGAIWKGEGHTVFMISTFILTTINIAFVWCSVLVAIYYGLSWVGGFMKE